MTFVSFVMVIMVIVALFIMVVFTAAETSLPWVAVPQSASGSAHEFHVDTGQRVIYMRAPTAEDKLRWMLALNMKMRHMERVASGKSRNESSQANPSMLGMRMSSSTHRGDVQVAPSRSIDASAALGSVKAVMS